MDRRDMILALIDAGDGSIAGVTRLQKFLFLLEKEYDLRPSEDLGFEAYRFGPYSPKLYDDLNFLEDLGLLEARADGELPATGTDVSEMDFGFLAGSGHKGMSGPSDEELVEREEFYADTTADADSAAAAASSDLGPERLYKLTDKARKYLSEKLDLEADGKDLRQAAKNVKGRFRSLGRTPSSYSSLTYFAASSDSARSAFNSRTAAGWRGT